MQKERIGFLLALLAACFYTSMSIFVKLAVEANGQLLVFTRNLLCVLLIIPVFFKTKVSFFTNKPLMHVTRATLGLGALYTSIYATKHLPLADAVLLFNTSPLFMPLVALLALKDPLPKSRLWAILVGFLGVFFLLRPDLSFFSSAGMIGLFSGAFVAMVLVTVRQLSFTEPPERIILYFFSLALIVSIFPMMLSWNPPKTPIMWLFVFLAGAFGFLYQFCITKAYSYVQPTKVCSIAYFGVLFGAMADYFIWDKLFDAVTFLGISLVVAGGVLISLERKT